MNKLFKLVISFLMILSVVGCGSSEKKETVKLEKQTVNGVEIAVPTDMPSFKKNKDGDKESQKKDKTAYITVGSIADGEGKKPSDFDESFIDDLGENLKNYKILEFDTDRKTNGVDTLFAKVSGKNKNKANVIMEVYMFFYADGTAQYLFIVYTRDEDTSLENNIEKINKSITVKQKENKDSTEETASITEFPLTIENKTGGEIVRLYCSTENTDDWEEDVLDVDTLMDDENYLINFKLTESGDLVWDFKLVTEAGGIYFYGVDFEGCPKSGATMTFSCNEQDYLLTLNGKTYTADDYD